MRMKAPPQPLVFCFTGVTVLCEAVSALYRMDAAIKASLCVYAEKYYLAVYLSLKKREKFRKLLREYGEFLGPGCVQFAYFAEYGRKITGDAVAGLGSAMNEEAN